MIFFYYLLFGAFTGIIAGTLGIGGGIIVVPGLVWLFSREQMPADLAMHVAVGTSLAIMSVTTVRAFFSHRQHKVPYWDIFKPLLPGLIVGVIVGSAIGHYLHARAIAIFFGIVQLILGLYMLFADKIPWRRELPGPTGITVLGGITGGLAGLLGIGGGSFITPFLTYCMVSIRKALMVSIVTSFVVSVIGAITAMWTGSLGTATAGLNWHTGYVYWPACLGVVVGSLGFVPLGATLSHRLPVNVLRRIFAVFLILVALDLLIRAR